MIIIAIIVILRNTLVARRTKALPRPFSTYSSSLSSGFFRHKATESPPFDLEQTERDFYFFTFSFLFFFFFPSFLLILILFLPVLRNFTMLFKLQREDFNEKKEKRLEETL